MGRILSGLILNIVCVQICSATDFNFGASALNHFSWADEQTLLTLNIEAKIKNENYTFSPAIYFQPLKKPSSDGSTYKQTLLVNLPIEKPFFSSPDLSYQFGLAYIQVQQTGSDQKVTLNNAFTHSNFYFPSETRTSSFWLGSLGINYKLKKWQLGSSLFIDRFTPNKSSLLFALHISRQFQGAQ